MKNVILKIVCLLMVTSLSLTAQDHPLGKSKKDVITVNQSDELLKNYSLSSDINIHKESDPSLMAAQNVFWIAAYSYGVLYSYPPNFTAPESNATMYGGSNNLHFFNPPNSYAICNGVTYNDVVHIDTFMQPVTQSFLPLGEYNYYFSGIISVPGVNNCTSSTLYNIAINTNTGDTLVIGTGYKFNNCETYDDVPFVNLNPNNSYQWRVNGVVQNFPSSWNGNNLVFSGVNFDKAVPNGQDYLQEPWDLLENGNVIRSGNFRFYASDPPSAVCQNTSVSLDSGGAASISVADIDNGSSGCDITMSLSQSNFDCSNTGTVSVTLTVTDSQGATDSCTSTVTVQDNEPPTVTCPEDFTIGTDPGLCTGYTTGWLVSAADNCDYELTSVYAPNKIFPLGPNTVVVTATDPSGNSVNCSFTITVDDDEPPVISCSDATLSLDSDGSLSVDQDDFNMSASDNCSSILTTVLFPNTFDCSQTGANTITITATDDAQNQSTCTATLTVVDDEPPTLVCPEDFTIPTDPGLCTGFTTGWSIDISDNCDYTAVGAYAPNKIFSLGPNTVTYTATDPSGNSANCSFIITVVDNEPPSAICQNILVQLDADGNTSITAADVDGGSTDNCGSVTISIDSTEGTFDCSDTDGAQSVTLTVTDDASNVSTCVAEVTVEDDIPPTAVCQDITVQLDDTGSATITSADVDGGSNDACGIASLEISSDDGDWNCDEVGANTVTLTVTDNNGNQSTCDATVTIEDNVPPTAVCQDITVQLDESGQATIEASDIDGGSTDACGIQSLEITTDDGDWNCSEVGDHTVTLTVTDNNDNESTCEATVTVEDNVPPTAVCQDITIELNAIGEAFVAAADIDGGSTDACGIQSLEIASDDEDWDCSEVGDHTVTLTVTDNNGNQSTCDATVTVEDNIPPTLVCADVIVNLDPGLCGEVVQYAIETSDNCGVDTEVLVSGPASGTYLDYHDGPWSVTWDVTDVNGNLSTCTFTITMEEYANPTETLACNDFVNISLDDTGCATIGADMILEGGPYGCYDDYEVSVDGGDAEVCCDELGETLMAMVTDPDTGNSCWGEIFIEDKLSPYCVSILDYTLDCTEELPAPDDVTHEGYPVFGDNCGVVLVNLASEIYLDDDICSNGGMVLQRVWFAFDASGNFTAPEDYCVQTITIERLETEFPADVALDCGDYDPEDLTPDVTGFPLYSDTPLCMYNATYSDQELDNCGDLIKIVRTWTLVDWCTGEVITEDANGNDNVQLIELIDDEGPEIAYEEYTMNAENADFCTSQGFIALPDITDNCSDIASVQMFILGYTELDYVYDADGNVIGGYIPFPGLPLGDHTLQVNATDACGNFASELMPVEVLDLMAPTAICDEITQTALTSDGTSTVFAETFDDGSHDNCCLEGFAVRRMDSDDENFYPSVTFNCDDVVVAVIMRVYDCYDNYNDCMVEVLVEDKLPPFLSVPPDASISCEEYYEDIAPFIDDAGFLDAEFGSAIFGDNCEATETYSYTYDVNQCGEGQIIRTWTVDDAAGNGPISASQVISVYHVSDWDVTFPADIDANCEDGQLPDFGYPEVTGQDCEMIAVSYTDAIFNVVPDACYKIIREWSVINWCTYPDEPARTATQVIKVIDNEAPVFSLDDITVEILEGDCDTAVDLPTPDVTDCSDDITITITSDLPDGEAGPGIYTAEYQVGDGCGNYSFEVITITVLDGKKPTPYLTDQLNVELMQTGMISVNVYDYDIGSFDNCSDVVLSFSPDTDDTDRVYTCDEGPGLYTLEVWVTDEAGNQDFATVLLDVQDNMNVCSSPDILAAGFIQTDQGNGVESVTVDVNGGLFSQVTDAQGAFSFSLESGGDYSFLPSLDEDADNGVTTFDIVLITRHILGLDPLDNGYQMIAADANNSQSVSTLDIVAIRKVILQMEDSFPNNTSWRFVSADHVFADPANPWGFPELINVNNMNSDTDALDFIGVKIGDINGSAQANGLQPAQDRGESILYLKTDEQWIKYGQEVSVLIESDEILSGLQYTLEHEGLQLQNIVSGLWDDRHIGIHDGYITLSWNDAEDRKLKGEALIEFVFVAEQSGSLSEYLRLSSKATAAEAYGQDRLFGLDLIFEGQEAPMNVLYQNEPNPFNKFTQIRFSLAKAGSAKVTVRDIAGNSIAVFEGTYDKGMHFIQFESSGLTGVYYYTLEVDGFTSTKRMIITE